MVRTRAGTARAKHHARLSAAVKHLQRTHMKERDSIGRAQHAAGNVDNELQLVRNRVAMGDFSYMTPVHPNVQDSWVQMEDGRWEPHARPTTPRMMFMPAASGEILRDMRRYKQKILDEADVQTALAKSIVGDGAAMALAEGLARQGGQRRARRAPARRAPARKRCVAKKATTTRRRPVSGRSRRRG